MKPEDQAQEVQRLRKLRDQCQSEGRLAQAMLINNILWEIESGIPWLEYQRRIAEEKKHAN